jgi:hypothetical protein
MGIVVTSATLSYGQWPHWLHCKIPKINNDLVEAQIGDVGGLALNGKNAWF